MSGQPSPLESKTLQVDAPDLQSAADAPLVARQATPDSSRTRRLEWGPVPAPVQQLAVKRVGALALVILLASCSHSDAPTSPPTPDKTAVTEQAQQIKQDVL